MYTERFQTGSWSKVERQKVYLLRINSKNVTIHLIQSVHIDLAEGSYDEKDLPSVI